MKKVILFSGKIGSGKNQSMEYVREILSGKGYSVKHEYFAKVLKDWCKEDFKTLVNYLNSFVEDIKTSIPDRWTSVEDKLNHFKISEENWYEKKTDITRILLQIYGTEIIRNRVDDNFWVEKVKENIRNSNADFYVISDVRFVSEVECMYDLEDVEVYTVRIERNIDRKNEFNEHQSETALDDYGGWTYIIENDKDLEYLKQCSITLVDDILRENN